MLALGNAELIDLAVDEAGRILGMTVQLAWTHVVRHSPGIPHAVAVADELVTAD